jgi:hypothetical protein
MLPPMSPRRALPALIALLLLAPAARAEDAASFLRKGIEAFSLADFERSRGLLSQAATLTRQPRLLAQIHLYRGLNDAATGAPAAARAAFTMALGLDPTLQLDPSQIKQDLLEAFEQTRRTLQGKLVVTASLPARVLIDGKDRGGLPLQLSLPIGAHRIEVRGADGLRRQLARIVVGPGQTTQHQALLEPVTGRLSVHSTPAGAEVYVDGERVGRTPLAGLELPAGPHAVTLLLAGHAPHVGRVKVEAERSTSLRTSLASTGEVRSRRRIWTWIAAAGAAAALGVGVGLGVASNADFQSYETRCGSSSLGPCGDLRESIRTRDLAANSLFGAAGALAIGSALLFYFEGRPSASERERPRVTPLAGGLGAAVSGSF